MSIRGKLTIVTLKMPINVLPIIDDYAKSMHMSRSELFRLALFEYLKAHGIEVDDFVYLGESGHKALVWAKVFRWAGQEEKAQEVHNGEA